MGNTSIYSEEEQNEIAQRAADNAEFEGNFDDLDDFDDYEDDEIETQAETVDTIIKRLKSENDIDIFQDVGEKLANHDMIVTYQIKKNGKFFTTKSHPYSWDEMQKEFCKQEGARFTVTAKNPDNGSYIKTQTLNIDRLPDSGRSNVDETRSQQPTLSTQELLALFQQNDEKSKREAAEKARSERETMLTLMQAMKPEKQDNSEILKIISEQSSQSTNTMVALMTAMMQNKPQDNSSDMLKFMVQMQQSAQERTERMMEKMSENTNKVLEQIMGVVAHKDEPEFSAFKVMELINSARSEGYEQFNTMNQLAELKAKERSEMLGDKKPEGITETILKSLAPALAQGLMTGKSQALPQPRGSVSHTPYNRQVRPQNRTATPTGPHQTARNPQQSRSVRRNSRQNTESRASSFPSVTKKVRTIENEPPKPQNTTPKPSVVESSTNSGKMVVNEAHKEKILNVAVPVVIEGYQNTESVEATVQKCLAAFIQNGIEMERVTTDLTEQDIIHLANHFGLDESVSVLLKEFYEKLHDELTRQYPCNG